MLLLQLEALSAKPIDLSCSCSHDGEAWLQTVPVSALGMSDLPTARTHTHAVECVRRAEDLGRMLSELAIEREDSEALMKLAGKTGDGVISFDEFKTLMLATTRPNSITRVSMMAPGIASGVPRQNPRYTL